MDPHKILRDIRTAVDRDQVDVLAELIGDSDELLFDRRLFMNGQTWLHHAVSSKAVNAVRWLVHKGIPVDITERAKLTPLHYAVFNPGTTRETLMELLLDLGADPEGSPEAQPLLHTAASLSIGPRCDCIKLLLAHGADIERRFGNLTPLMAAASAGKMESVMALLWAGADVMATGGPSEPYLTALEIAELHQNYEVADTIRPWVQAIEAQSTIDQMTELGSTQGLKPLAFHRACA